MTSLSELVSFLQFFLFLMPVLSTRPPYPTWHPAYTTLRLSHAPYATSNTSSRADCSLYNPSGTHAHWSSSMISSTITLPSVYVIGSNTTTATFHSPATTSIRNTVSITGDGTILSTSYTQPTSAPSSTSSEAQAATSTVAGELLFTAAAAKEAGLEMWRKPWGLGVIFGILAMGM